MDTKVVYPEIYKDVELVYNSAELDARVVKNFKISVDRDINILLANSQDGDSGNIILLVDNTGGYQITFGAGFLVKVGTGSIDTTGGKINLVRWTNIGGDVILYSIEVS